MNGATLKTLREALCLPVAWMADACEVQERTVRYWESSNALVPDDVGRMVEKLEIVASTMTDEAVASITSMIEQYGLPGHPVRLVRYGSAEDMHRYQPELRGLPATFHGAILARVRWAMTTQGVTVEIRVLSVPAYEAWLKATQQQDSAALRAQFIAIDD